MAAPRRTMPRRPMRVPARQRGRLLGPTGRALGAPARAYQTYGVHSPVQTHTRPATCAEVDCQAQAQGFAVTVDPGTDLGARQALYLRSECLPLALPASAAARGRRRYREVPQPGGLVRFEFPAGTECFAEHRVPLGRPELYIVRDGDRRGNPTGRLRRHAKPEHWVEDFAQHQDRIATLRERG